jgi:hypothetical protein
MMPRKPSPSRAFNISHARWGMAGVEFTDRQDSPPQACILHDDGNNISSGHLWLRVVKENDNAYFIGISEDNSNDFLPATEARARLKLDTNDPPFDLFDDKKAMFGPLNAGQADYFLISLDMAARSRRIQTTAQTGIPPLIL